MPVQANGICSASGASRLMATKGFALGCVSRSLLRLGLRNDGLTLRAASDPLLRNDALTPASNPHRVPLASTTAAGDQARVNLADDNGWVSNRHAARLGVGEMEAAAWR